jgi:cell division protein FtsB
MIISTLRRLDWVVTLCCGTLLGYMAWHAFGAPGGYEQLSTQRLVLAQKQADAQVLVGKREILEARVSLVRPESLDPDILDELARRELGWAGRDDLIALLKGGKLQVNSAP